MSDVDEFLSLLGSGNSLELARLARAHARNGGASSFALNAILYSPEVGDPEARISAERARHLNLLADAPEQMRALLVFNLGCIALYDDDILAAKLRFGEAARLSPGHHASLHNLAHAHELMADFDEARIVLERALNANPGCVLTRINLAVLCFASGETEHGLNTLREVAAAQPENMGVALYLCRSLLEHGGREGTREARDLLEQRPGWEQYPELVACRAYACYLTGAWQEAETLFRELLELNPGSPFALMGIIKVLAAREDTEALLQHLERYQDAHSHPPVGHIIDNIKGN